jgi:hypothetical protein
VAKFMKHCLLFLVCSIVFCTVDSSAQPVEWEIVTADTAKIAVPREWRNMDGIEVTRPVYRQGDGIGVPSTDETGAPMQIGLTVEKFPISQESTETIAKELVKGATNNPQLVMVGKESAESIILSDQTAATLITTEFIKSGSRRSLYMKLIGKDSKGQVLVVTGYMVSGKGSTWPTPKSKLATWLRAHLVSLTLSGKDVDQKKIEAAYQARDKGEKALEDSGPPRAGLTGSWTASWHDPQSNSREVFTMDLVQKGTNVGGTAVFMDGNDTKAKVAGQANGSKIELLMTPHSPAIPKTKWIGTLTNNTISGTWSLHGTRSDGSTGSWSARPQR